MRHMALSFPFTPFLSIFYRESELKFHVPTCPPRTSKSKYRVLTQAPRETLHSLVIVVPGTIFRILQ